MTRAAPILDAAFVAAFRSGTLTPDQAEAVLPRDRAAAIFFLQLSSTLGPPTPASGAHQPSGSIPPYAKPPAPPRRKKRGAQPGHAGAARPRPEQIDRREVHQLPACPTCGGNLTRTRRSRTRIAEDIPADLKPVVTEHTIHRDWCPCCRKQVDPQVPDALPSRITDLAVSDWAHAHARRLGKRLHKYGENLLTFVEFEGVPSSNNHAEREVRPAVLIGKASYGNPSERGARTRSVLMSVVRTLKRRGLDPMSTVVDALRSYATTGTLPPLPEKASSEGGSVTRNGPAQISNAKLGVDSPSAHLTQSPNSRIPGHGLRPAIARFVRGHGCRLSASHRRIPPRPPHPNRASRCGRALRSSPRSAGPTCPCSACSPTSGSTTRSTRTGCWCRSSPRS
ncbi:hypothetical protein C1280_33910 [Gemmata obscuriglobus]|uniref:Uncharacterized protein n=1 Tax=Gemmata obscuriglobus TaxID=114 RepID=A0A2Z3HD53_9BACT|nr:hypothetical protein C1280_33910 [Gemmata obscuriglobus]